MQFAPAPRRADTAFLIQPFALAVDLQAGAIDKEMQWFFTTNRLWQDGQTAPPAVALHEIRDTCRAVPLRERCEPCAEQFDAGAAIHCPLERLQPIDLTLDRPVAPAFRQRVPHRRKVVAYGSRKALYRLQATPGRLVQPLIELVEIATPHDPSKAHREPSHGAEARGRLLQRHNLCRLRLGQHAFRFHTKGGCHDWGDLPSGCRVDRRTLFAEWLWAG